VYRDLESIKEVNTTSFLVVVVYSLTQKCPTSCQTMRLARLCPILT